MENELRPFSLPLFVLKKIQLVKEPYYDYFIGQLPYKYEAVRNIQNDNMRMSALIDLEKEAGQLLQEYVNVYSNFLAEFEDWVSANRTKNEQGNASLPETHKLFYNSEEEFRHLPDQMKITLKQVKATLEIKKKIGIKNPAKIDPNKRESTEIHKAFTKLFVSPFIAASFVNLLKEAEYVTENGEWKGVSNRPGELREAYRVLKSLDLLTPGKIHLESLKIFYLRFGLKPEAPGVKDHYISIKSLSSATETKDYTLFQELLTPWQRSLPPLPLPN